MSSSWKALTWATSQVCGKSADKFTLIMLAAHADESFSCYPGIPKLATEMEVSESTVYAALARLEKAGLIRVLQRWRRGGSRRSNRYQLMVLGPDTPLPDVDDWQRIRAEWATEESGDAGSATIPPESGGMADQPERGQQTSKTDEGIPPASGGSNLQNPEVTYKEHELPEVEQTPPTPPPTEPAAPEPAGAATPGGDDLGMDERTRATLNALVDRVAEQRGWRPQKIRAAIRAAFDGRFPPNEVIAGLSTIAADPSTAFPGRLVVHLERRRAERQTADTAPRVIQVLDRNTPRCTEPGHEAQLAGNCVQCKADQMLRDEEPGAEPVDRDTAIAQARSVAGRRPHRTGPALPGEEPRPAGLDRLRELTADAPLPPGLVIEDGRTSAA